MPAKPKRKEGPPKVPRARAKPPLPPPGRRKAGAARKPEPEAPLPGQKPKSATGFSAIVRGVAEAAVQSGGVGEPFAPASQRPPDVSISRTTMSKSSLESFGKDAPGRSGVRVTTKSFGLPEAKPKHNPMLSSMPEISVSYRPGGRETLAAIERELSPDRVSEPPEMPTELAGERTTLAGPGPLERPSGSPPHRSTLHGPVGAPDEPVTKIRERQTTLGWEDRPRTNDSTPEVITVGESPIGQTTLAAIAREAADSDPGELSFDHASLDEDTIAAITQDTREAAGDPSSSKRARGFEIHEVVSFVVHGLDPEKISAPAKLREFIAQNLMHRLPVWSVDDVDEVSVSPSESGEFFILQILCRLTPGG